MLQTRGEAQRCSLKAAVSIVFEISPRVFSLDMKLFLFPIFLTETTSKLFKMQDQEMLRNGHK